MPISQITFNEQLTSRIKNTTKGISYLYVEKHTLKHKNVAFLKGYSIKKAIEKFQSLLLQTLLVFTF